MTVLPVSIREHDLFPLPLGGFTYKLDGTFGGLTWDPVKAGGPEPTTDRYLYTKEEVRQIQIDTITHYLANRGNIKVKSGKVAVDHSYFWLPMTTCPVGSKVQLLNPGHVATYGAYRREPYWQGWAPLPKIRRDDHVNT